MKRTKGGNATNLSYRIQNILFWHDIGRGRSLIKQKKDAKEFMIILFELQCQESIYRNQSCGICQAFLWRLIEAKNKG